MSSKLLLSLPNQFNSPASAAKDSDGNIYFTSPNIHNDLLEQAGEAPQAPCIGKLTPDNVLSTWYTFSPDDMLAATGKIGPMGIAFGPDGHLYVADSQLWFEDGLGESRILRINVDNGEARSVSVVASGFMFPNGIVWQGDQLYITDTVVKSEPGEYTISGLYRCSLTELQPDNPVKISRYTSTKNQDPHLFDRFVSSGKMGFGANGVAIDNDGHLDTGVMEDGIIVKTSTDAQQNKTGSRVFAHGMVGPDGMVWDKTRNLFFIADLFLNAVFSIDLDGKLTTLARNGDTDGAEGELDAPSEVIVRGNELIVMNFDAVFDFEEMVNKSAQKPFTLSVSPL